MKELAAYLLCVLGGKQPSVDEITAVISAAGGEVDTDKLNVLLADLEGKDVNEIIAKGKNDLKNVSVGGGGGGGGAAPPAAGMYQSLFRLFITRS
jgi:large subunit ribosomal protein LP2